MRFPAILILFLAPAFLTTDVSAQGGRTDTKTNEKRNQRTADPTPTPPLTVSTPADDGEVIKVSTTLVSLPVRVMDKKGLFIGGLAKENFKVYEDGVEQEVAMFSNENEPFTVALVLDMSYSTTFKLAEIQSAAIAFIDQLRPQDKVMVVSFAAEVKVLSEPTSVRKEIANAIRATRISTGTSLYEAVDLVVNDRLRHIDGRKAVILFTDGVDTTSRRTFAYDNLSDSLESDSLIYTIRYDTFRDVQNMSRTGVPQVPGPRITRPVSNPFPTGSPTIDPTGAQGTTAEEYEAAEKYLEELSQRTGARSYNASSVGNLSEAYAKIASELREFYSVGYYPNSERIPGKKAAIKVRVDREGVSVRSREGILRRKTESPRIKE